VPTQHDVGAVNGNAVVVMRQILAHQISVNRMAREPRECFNSIAAKDGDAPRSCHCTERAVGCAQK
jgi:hypothetical protein